MATLPPEPLEGLAPESPIHQVRPELLDNLRAAQGELLWRVFPDARSLCEEACRGVGADPALAAGLEGEPLYPFADLTLLDLVERLTPTALSLGLSPEQAAEIVPRVAERVQLVRAFSDPDAVLGWVVDRVTEKLGRLPQSADDLMVGLNPGDVIDPFMVAAAQELLYQGSFELTIMGLTAHKALMMMEDLVGHLHQEVIGTMRGNVRVPEPAGEDKEALNYRSNPFPGADIMQPPWDDKRGLRFHQVKNKTGSAKGGDARRVGEQLKLLIDTYGGDAYFDAVIGSTLRGHRSMGGILKAEPRTVVLVGEAAFVALTGSRVGAELLLRVYQTALRQVANASGYSVTAVATRIATEFKRRAEESGEDYLRTLLDEVVGGDPDRQSSRTYVGSRGRRVVAADEEVLSSG